MSISVGVKDFSLLGLFTGDDEDTFLALISRIPRTISIILTGAGLALAGLIMQTVTNNKFVSPSVIGTMAWCRLGIVLAIMFIGGESKSVKMVFAFIISLGGTLVFMGILDRIKFKSALMVPLVGMMLGSVIDAISMFFAYRYDVVQNMSSWMMGNFSLSIKGNYEILFLGIPCLIIAYIYANKFTIAGIGESFAKNLGLNYKLVVLIGLVIVAFISSLIVVTVGSIPFVGLVIPNLISLYKGDNLKGSLLETALVGAIFLLMCDIIGRVIIFPFEVNVSIVCSIVGSIIFLIILFKRNV